MPRGAERAMLGCFPVARRPPPSLSYEEGSTSAASMSVSTASPAASSTASTSSPAFLDDDVDAAALYPDVDAAAEPDAGGLSNAIAARRFFLASPGRSNSIFDSVVDHHPHPAAAASLARDGSVVDANVRALRRAATSAFPAASSTATASSSAAATKAPFRGGGPVRKVSVSTDAPRADFLKSMVEMVEALGLDPRRRDADLARLHDLLLCYIALNEREALRDILGAFADLMCLLDVGGDSSNAAAEKRDADDVQGRTTAGA